MKNSLYLLLAITALSACEDPITVNVQQKEIKMVVDAFVNNLPDTQNIYLKYSANYFAPIGQQDPITDAQVYLIDTTGGGLHLFNFSHNANGRYIFVPNSSTGDTFTVNHQYALAIIKDTDTFFSISMLEPTAIFKQLKRIDEPGGGGITQGAYAEVDAQDLPQLGNTYWFKTYRNDTFRGSINELNIAYDQAFSPSSNNNGGEFIWPIRYGGINNFNRPNKSGDKVKVEIHSINLATYYYLQLIQSENQNGGLFATPPAAIPSNIVRFNSTGKLKATGWFNMSAVAAKTLVF